MGLPLVSASTRAGKPRPSVAALRQDGLTAPMVTEGPMNGELFLAYVREFLCPTLAAGDIVIWDRLSSHQG